MAYFSAVLWRHANAIHWYNDIIFADDCSCCAKWSKNHIHEWISSINIDLPPSVIRFVACKKAGQLGLFHEDVIKGKHFPRSWPFVRGIHRTPVNSSNKSQCLWCLLWSTPWINGWVNNREAGDLRRHRVHYDVIVIFSSKITIVLLPVTVVVWFLARHVVLISYHVCGNLSTSKMT